LLAHSQPFHGWILLTSDSGASLEIIEIVIRKTTITKKPVEKAIRSKRRTRGTITDIWRILLDTQFLMLVGFRCGDVAPTGSHSRGFKDAGAESQALAKTLGGTTTLACALRFERLLQPSF